MKQKRFVRVLVAMLAVLMLSMTVALPASANVTKKDTGYYCYSQWYTSSSNIRGYSEANFANTASDEATVKMTTYSKYTSGYTIRKINSIYRATGFQVMYNSAFDDSLSNSTTTDNLITNYYTLKIQPNRANNELLLSESDYTTVITMNEVENVANTEGDFWMLSHTAYWKNGSFIDAVQGGK